MVLCLVAQLCPTLCDPVDCSPPGSSAHGILQARYWSGLPFPPPGDFPDPGIKPTSPVSPALAGRFFTTFIGLGSPVIVYMSVIKFEEISDFEEP